MINRVKNWFLKKYPWLRFIKIDPSKIIWAQIANYSSADSVIQDTAKVYGPYKIDRALIGEYSYIAGNSNITFASIGKFCSIGMNFVCGRGIHPTNGISTSPYFYSTHKQNGYTLSAYDKFEERKKISIGNDVFIGMNVTILDGISIGDGAIIGAGAIVSKDIPPYAIAVGNPIRILRYRFDERVIEELLRIKWWDRSQAEIALVEKYFFDVQKFISEINKIDGAD